MDVHVYTVVRVKIVGEEPREGETLQAFANRVSDAVCSDPSAWLKPVYGRLEGDASGDVEQVEFAEGIEGVMVDVPNPNFNGDLRQDEYISHHFDKNGEPWVQA